MLTPLLFAAVCLIGAVVWNRWFRPVPWSVVAVLWLACAAYQGETLFTARVDVPGNLAYAVQPWKATGGSAVQANTGIVWSQLAPWSRVARDFLLAGEAPLWNRTAASGAPLLANQQTAIFHPFTLLGLLLPLGKAFTLSAALRLFFVAFFTFLFLRNWSVGTGGALFGAVAFTFCTFHVVWLLFPLGLSTMMLPLCITGVQEVVRERRGRSWALLLSGLTLAVLGGHPESAMWVWIVTLFVAVYECIGTASRMKERALLLSGIASAFVVSMLLTAFFWWPTLRALDETPRFQAAQSRAANPADHGLSAEWLLPLLAPNVLGNPVNATYTPPRGSHAAVLNDYGEVASGYAGLLTLALALAAPLVARRRPLGLALSLLLFSILTFAEAPLWRDVLRELPLVGVSIHQRLRIFWNVGVCIAAALTVDEVMRGARRRAVIAVIASTAAAFVVVYAIRRPPFALQGLGLAHFAIPLATCLAGAVALMHPRRFALAATALILIDLTSATWRYNPPAEEEDLYPVTGAIAVLADAKKPVRFAALGWSMLPDTPGWYGIEDIKTTDPIQNARYMRLMRGYLDVEPASYDQIIRDTSQPFFDYLNIGHVYVPPEHPVAEDGHFTKVYSGPDGTLLRNERVLPRYFLVERFSVEPSFGEAVWRSKQIADFRVEALVDHVPEKIRRQAPSLGTQEVNAVRGGTVSVRRYGANATVLDVSSDGWNLLVSSDVHWPGWRAYWNGRRQPPVVVNGAFLGCFVPPGRGELLFRYVPDEYARGVQVAAITAFLLLVVALARWVIARRAPLR